MYCCDVLLFNTCDGGESCECRSVDVREAGRRVYTLIERCDRPYVERGDKIMVTGSNEPLTVCPYCGERVADA